jgi:sucrose phosphorylase
MKNQVQLIAYADRFGGSLPTLNRLLREHFSGLFGGVHLLPFFSRIDGADAGFDPADHLSIDERLGSWQDVHALAQQIDVMADAIVNHISVESQQFQDFSLRGGASAYARLFLTLDDVFPDGATEGELLSIYRPRPGLPFTPMTLKDGSRQILWTTFAPQQIDIDVTGGPGRDYLDSILRTFAANAVRMVRLDAVGYAVKRRSTDCFMIPETYAFIAELTARARQLGLEVLVEVHSHYRRQIDIAAHVDRVYDFALPPLVLHALFRRTSMYLKYWLEIRPRNCLTVLDTHDGIGVIDAGPTAGSSPLPGLLPAAELERTVEEIHIRSNGESRRASGAAARNLDLYQVNCTFYDALGRNDNAYLLARAVQFFLPGVPQVYYVGLLAGGNDIALLDRTGAGRDINRHYYDAAEVALNLMRPVVQKLLELIRLRNAHPAFGGEFRSHGCSDTALDLEWRSTGQSIRLHVDFATEFWRIDYSTATGVAHLQA